MVILNEMNYSRTGISYGNSWKLETILTMINAGGIEGGAFFFDEISKDWSFRLIKI